MPWNAKTIERTISLIQHASEIMLKKTMESIEGKAINVISKTQIDFKKGMVP